MNINDIKDMVKFIKSNKIKEFYYKKDDEEIKIVLDLEEAYKHGIKKGISARNDYAAQISNSEQADLVKFAGHITKTVETELNPIVRNEHLKEIVSPFVGSFYRSASPEKSPFVEVDSIVEKGAPVCIIEAMKIMNEIEVDIKCRIVSILAENGQLVEFGQPLFLVEPV